MKIDETVLVIAEHLLEAAYPGGVRGLLRDQRRAHKSQKLTCTDGVVAVSDDDADSLIATYDRLTNLFKNAAIDTTPCVFVDPVDGALEACDWLIYSPTGDGSANVSVNARCAPPKTTKRRASRTPRRSSTRPKTPATDATPASPTAPVLTLMKLTEDGNYVTWLDLETGRELVSEAPPPPRPRDDADAPMPMLDAVKAVIARRGWDESTFDDEDDGTVVLRLDAGLLLAVTVFFVPSSRGNALRIAVRLPGRTPKDRLDAVANYILGANWGLEVGGFDMDYTDGEVMYRAALVAPDGELRPSSVEIALNRSMGSATHYAAGLMEVAGGADPRAVLARVDPE